MDTRKDEVRGLQRDLSVILEEKKQLERTTSSLLKAKQRTNAILAEALAASEKHEKEIMLLEKQNQDVQKEREMKLSKREDLEYELRVKDLEAKHAGQLSTEISILQRENSRTNLNESPEKKEARLLAMEEKKRLDLIKEKENLRAEALSKEKEKFEKKVQELNLNEGVGKYGFEKNKAALSDLEHDITKLKNEGDLLANKEKSAEKQIQNVQSEKIEIKRSTRSASFSGRK